MLVPLKLGPKLGLGVVLKLGLEVGLPPKLGRRVVVAMKEEGDGREVGPPNDDRSSVYLPPLWSGGSLVTSNNSVGCFGR